MPTGWRSSGRGPSSIVLMVSSGGSHARARRPGVAVHRRLAAGRLPRVQPTLDAELLAAHGAVDAAVAVLRDARASQGRLTRIAKQAKDFLTEVDLAAEAALKRALERSTPDVGFFGEEGGGDAPEI